MEMNHNQCRVKATTRRALISQDIRADIKAFAIAVRQVYWINCLPQRDFQNVWHTTFSFVKSNDYKNANSTISRLIMRTIFIETKDIVGLDGLLTIPVDRLYFQNCENIGITV
jgi:hypothetical protein